MADKMTHQEYVQQQRDKIIDTAILILKNKIDILKGCRIISSLWFEAELTEDADYYFFELIDLDTEDIPKGLLREKCSKQYLEEKDKKEEEYLKDFRDKIKEHCQNLIEKYSEI